MDQLTGKDILKGERYTYKEEAAGVICGNLFQNIKPSENLFRKNSNAIFSS